MSPDVATYEFTSAWAGVGSPWGSYAIGVVSLLHILLAALSMGFMIVAPVLEWRGRTRASETAVARSLTRFTVLVFSVSTVLAVIMVELLIGLFPATTMWVWNHFRLSLYVAMGAFATGILTLYPYYHGWDAIRRRSVNAHLVLGSAAAIAMLVWVVVLDGMGSSMLTPGSSSEEGLIRGNPTWAPLVVHRLLADLVIAGYAMAGYAAWKLTGAREPSDRSYAISMLKLGWFLGIGTFLLQPWSGLLYGMTLADASPAAYEQLIRGRFQDLFYLQVGLVGLLFVGNQIVIGQARGRPWAFQWIDAAMLLAALTMVGFAPQAGVRRTALAALVLLTLWSLWTLRWPAAWREARWMTTAATRSACIALAMVAMALYLTMGIIRETIRYPDTVRGVVTLDDRAAYSLRSGESR